MIKHQQIIDNIKTAMKTILTTNGYHTNLGLKVYLNKANSLIENADENALNIKDISLSAITAKSGGVISFFDYTMPIDIDIHFKGGASITEIREGIWDVQKVIGLNLNWGGLAINSYPPEGSEFIQLIFEQEENIIVGAKIYFIIEFRTTQWQEE